MSNTLDNQVDLLLKAVEEKKKEVEKVEASAKKGWITTTSFRGLSTSPVNIQVASESDIVKCMTELILLSNARAEAEDVLGVVSKGFKLDGFSAEDWTEDFKKRIATLQLKSKKDALKQIEDQLNTLISPEQRREKEIARLAESLKNMQ